MTEANRRILIVDNRELEAALLGVGRDLGASFELSSAVRGGAVEHVRTARAAGRPYALVVTALGGEVFEAIARMWEADGDLHVVVCTASGAGAREVVARFGLTERLVVLRTPFEVVELCQLIGVLLQKWQLGHDARSRGTALAQSRAELERMVSMGRLAAGVGHEINNPLTYVLGNIENLLEAAERPDGAPPADLIERLNEARDGLLRIRVIVRDLQTLTRADEAHTELDLRQVLDQAIQMAGAELRYRAPIVRRYDAVAMVQGSRTRLGQVFLNLIVNAAQAIPEGRTADNRIEIAIREIGPEIVVEVTDTGAGIAAEHLERIFDPFFTTKPVGAGTGLGLSISREIVAGHGGSLAARSAPGAGTTMTVRLPHARRIDPPVPAPVSAPVPAAVPPVAPSVRQAKVLVIDDEPLIARILQRALSRHQVIVANQARDALARIEQGETFDVILCDLMMPDVSGIDVHEYLTREHPAIARRLVFMTGGAFTAKAKSFLSGVTNERIDKPFSLVQVTQLVDRYVEARQRRRSTSAGYNRRRVT